MIDIAVGGKMTGTIMSQERVGFPEDSPGASRLALTPAPWDKQVTACVYSCLMDIET